MDPHRNKALTLRPALSEDGPFLLQWMSDPQISRWFPMAGIKEVEDSVRIWMEYATKEQGITAVWNGTPCGMAVIYVQPFQRLKHTCLLSILVDEQYRNLGVGTALMEELEKLARDIHHIEILHLEVYEGNPAQHLYERRGFTSYGIHPHFAKEETGYRAKIFMQKYLT